MLDTCISGEWLLFIVCLGRDYLTQDLRTTNSDGTLNSTDEPYGFLERHGLAGLHVYLCGSVVVCFCTYWGIGLTLDVYFYKNRKHQVTMV